MSRITLWGFYNYTDKKLFDNILLPQSINKEDLVDLIMIECGDLFPYYQHPQYLKMQIENFFRRKYEGFSKMADALAAEYDPLENYDRKEDWSDKGKEKGSSSTSESVEESGSENVEGTATDTTSDSNTGTATNEVSAMDSNTFVNDSKSTSTSSGSSEATTTNESSRTTSNESSRELSKLDTVDNESSHTGRVHGNIGVTTSMQLIKEELALREYDLLERIVRIFEKDVIIQLY